MTLEYCGSKLPPNIEFATSPDGRRVFEDAQGNLVFAIRNTLTGEKHISTLPVPLATNHHIAVLKSFQQAIRTAVEALLRRTSSSPNEHKTAIIQAIRSAYPTEQADVMIASIQNFEMIRLPLRHNDIILERAERMMS